MEVLPVDMEVAAEEVVDAAVEEIQEEWPELEDESYHSGDEDESFEDQVVVERVGTDFLFQVIPQDEELDIEEDQRVIVEHVHRLLPVYVIVLEDELVVVSEEPYVEVEE